MAASDYWTMFSAEATKIGSPLYGMLSLKVRDDEKLRSIAAHAKPGQPHANLIFAAVHYLLLSEHKHELAKHYPSLSSPDTKGSDAFELFRDFCLTHEADITRLVASRITNTNEVARCTALFPAFDHIARQAEAPLHMIEIGPSAGFNLNWNHYSYVYRRNAQDVLHRAPPMALLALSTDLRGDNDPLIRQEFPTVASKVGLELNPVNLSSAEDRLWLKALVFPELTHRIARLEGAIATAQLKPPRIKVGDALDLIAPEIKALPKEGVPVVYHSFVTYQFSHGMREQFHETLLKESKARPIYRVSIEWEGAEHPVAVSRYDNGECGKVVLADCNPHGAWLEWRANAKA